MGDDARRQAHLRRDRRRASRPTSRRARRSSPTPSTASSPTAVAGSQELSAIAKLYELYEEHDFDVIVLDTPPSRNALDFLDAPDRLLGFLEGRALQVFLAPGGLTARLFGRGTALVFSIFARVTGVDMLGELSSFFRSLSSVIDGFGERTRGVAALLRAPETAFLIVTSPEPEPAREARVPGRAAGRGGDAAGAADRQPRPPRRPRRPLARGGRRRCSSAELGDELAGAGGAQPRRLRRARAPRPDDRSRGCSSTVAGPPPVLVPHLDEDVQDLLGPGSPDRRTSLRREAAGRPAAPHPGSRPRCARPALWPRPAPRLGLRRVLRRRARRGRGSRCPQITSRSSARRWSATSVASASRPACSTAVPATIARSSASASSDALGQLRAPLRRRAQRGEAPGEQPAGGSSGSSSARSASRWSLSASYAALALAAELEAPQRPRELVAVRRAARDEVAERAQLVLLLGGDDEHPARAAARAERERRPCAGRRPAPRRARQARRARRRTAAARAAGRRGRRAPARALRAGPRPRS